MSMSAAAVLHPSDTLEGASVKERLKGGIVFVGTSYGGLGALKDLHVTPLGLMSGSALLINTYNTIAHGSLRDAFGDPSGNDMDGRVFGVAHFGMYFFAIAAAIAINTEFLGAFLAILSYLMVSCAVLIAFWSIDGRTWWGDLMLYPLVLICADLAARMVELLHGMITLPPLIAKRFRAWLVSPKKGST